MVNDCRCTASALAAGALTFAMTADARVVSVQLSAPTIAFGGYSWPGVGQYEKITGVAYAEVDPNDARNGVIVDIKNIAETMTIEETAGGGFKMLVLMALASVPGS